MGDDGSVRRAFLIALAVAALAAPASSSAQTLSLAEFPQAGETFAAPFHVTSPPGDTRRVFVVEAGGTIRLVKDGVTEPAPFLDLSAEVFDFAEGGNCECGVFSIAFAPDYATSGRFYAFYTADDMDLLDPGHLIRITEFRRSGADPDLADPATRRLVLEIDHPSASNHNGGQLQFGPDGLLYIATGDGGGGQSANAQNTGSLLGKLLRINPAGAGAGDYSVPADNPFVGVAGADEIYSTGLRNPYRFSFDRLTGDLVIGDVGEGQWEEIDFLPRGLGNGANFGWNCFEADAPIVVAPPCPPAAHVPPVHKYPNPAGGGAAIIGGFVVRDTALPTLLGRYLYTDQYIDEVRSISLAPGGSSGDTALALDPLFSPVSFGEDACAHVYVTTFTNVYRLEPENGPFPCAPQRAPSLTAPPPVAGTMPPATTTRRKKCKRKRGKAKKRCKRRNRRR